MAGGRPTKYDPAFCEDVVAHMSEGASLTSFAAEIDVCRATINVWMAEHDEFLEAVNKAKAKCAAWWEKTARNGAIGGSANPTLCIFGLKNMAADDWRDKHELAGSGENGEFIHTFTRNVVDPREG